MAVRVRVGRGLKRMIKVCLCDLTVDGRDWASTEYQESGGRARRGIISAMQRIPFHRLKLPE